MPNYYRCGTYLYRTITWLLVSHIPIYTKIRRYKITASSVREAIAREKTMVKKAAGQRKDRGITAWKFLVTPLTEQEPSQECIPYGNRSFRAQFLTAVTVNTTVVFEGWRSRLVAGVPVHRFGGNGTHLDTRATSSTNFLINSWARAYPVLDERPQRPTRFGGRRFSNYFKVLINKGIYIVTDHFNVFVMIGAQS